PRGDDQPAFDQIAFHGLIRRLQGAAREAQSHSEPVEHESALAAEHWAAQPSRAGRSHRGRVAAYPDEPCVAAEGEGRSALRPGEGRGRECQDADQDGGLHSDPRSAMVSGPARTTRRTVRRRVAFSALTASSFFFQVSRSDTFARTLASSGLGLRAKKATSPATPTVAPTAKRAPLASFPGAKIDGSATADAPATSPAASERKAGPLDVRSGNNAGSGGQASGSGGSCLTSRTTWRARGPSAVGRSEEHTSEL